MWLSRTSKQDSAAGEMGLPIGKKILNTTQIKNYYEEQPPGLKWRSNTIFILATVAIGLFTDLFLYGLVVPVLPFLLQGRIGVPEDQVQTYTSALLAVYAGSSVIASPIAGWFADSVATRQAPFLFALATLTVATIVLFLGETIPVLVVARILQGISSGFVWTVGLALCIETVGPENLGKAIGTVSFTADKDLQCMLTCVQDVLVHISWEPLGAIPRGAVV